MPSCSTKHPDSTYHICSIIVQVSPDMVDTVKMAINQLSGCEIHYQKVHQLVVSVESADSTEAYNQMQHIQNTKGVLSVDLVSHFFE